ncbi:MAG TPA: tetratricopeptide repeat protein [Candidatus Hydrogenedentes bacterium]|nr:tetratricopeptide repeat protein [Candidatus Hydrogenedentota bacterium]HIJ73529.1 tetratricopeptide repeat protein [Candidatus Hydrogenedentota bacterium]
MSAFPVWGIFRIRQSGFPLSLIIGATLIASCTTMLPAPLPGSARAGRSGVLEERVARTEVLEAERMIEAGDDSGAIPRLLLSLSRYPESEAALDARYLLGVTYRRVGSYKDAMDMFTEYLRLAPKGGRADACSRELEQLTSEYNRKFPTPEKMDAQIALLETKLEAQPEALVYQWELADLLWRRGSYEEAGRLYAGILEGHPEYDRDPVVTRRIERMPNGEYVALTPAEILRRDIERRPLEVINQNAFRSGRDLLTREQRYYVVTGQVLNRSDSVLYGVAANVTIFGFGNVVFDTTTVSIGRMNPGEIRAFSVRFRKFENIENISRYESTVTFQR